MDLKEIKQIVKLMEDHGLSYFHFNKDGVDLKLKKGMDLEGFKQLLSAMPSVQSSSAAPPPAPLAAPAAAPAPAPQAAEAEAGASFEGEEVTAPMVGTFYRKPTPESPSFVEIGSEVKEGQTLCIIEAMKVMNEIKSEKAGTITAIFADDSSPVQYGDPLFAIK